MVLVSIYTILGLAGSIAGKRLNPSSNEDMALFRSLFGVSPRVCLNLWHQHINLPPKAKPKHLLWALLYLKVYGTEQALSGMVHVTRKTYRKWVRIMVGAIAAAAPYVVRLFTFVFLHVVSSFAAKN